MREQSSFQGIGNLGFDIMNIENAEKFFNREIKDTLYKVLITLWILISIMSLLFVMTPFIVPEEHIFSISSKLQSNHEEGQRCFFCGMTRGYVFMAKFKIEEAQSMNIFVPIFFVGTLLNELFLLSWIIRYLYRVNRK